MDFLTLFLIYLDFMMISVLMIWIYPRSHHLTSLVQGGTQLFSCIIPQCLQRAMQRWLRYFFYTRNYTFVILQLVLQGLVYIEYTWEILGYCQELEFSLCYLLLPYLLLTVNLVFFALTCLTNPGTITRTNELLLLQVYEFDGVMFPKNARCSSCGLKKPARSKHCIPVPDLPKDCLLAGLCRGAELPPWGLPVLCCVPGCNQSDHERVDQRRLGLVSALPPGGQALLS